MNDAMDLCERAISRAATNRSSVRFKSPDPLPRVRQMIDGQYEVYTRFAAKNGFGSESISMARCVISSDSQTVVELTATDSR